MMDAVRKYETSSETTRRYTTEDSHLCTRHRENLKSHNVCYGSNLLQVLTLCVACVA
jgi:hypothetical protein